MYRVNEMDSSINTRTTDGWHEAISTKTSENDWLVFKKNVIIEYLYIYWFITFLQTQSHVM